MDKTIPIFNTFVAANRKTLLQIRSALYEASQLPGEGPTDVEDAPAPAR